MDETLIEVHELGAQEAAKMIGENWNRFIRCRWVIRQDDQGYDVGFCVNRDRMFDWTDNPSRSGVYSADHIEEWELEDDDMEDDLLRSRVFQCLPPVPHQGLVTVVLERE